VGDKRALSLILPRTLTEDALKATGIHIGVKGHISKDMAPYIKEIAPTGNPIMDVNKILERLDVVGKHLGQTHSPSSMLPTLDLPMLSNRSTMRPVSQQSPIVL